jgi:hypothetical protein
MWRQKLACETSNSIGGTLKSPPPALLLHSAQWENPRRSPFHHNHSYYSYSFNKRKLKLHRKKSSSTTTTTTNILH